MIIDSDTSGPQISGEDQNANIKAGAQPRSHATQVSQLSKSSSPQAAQQSPSQVEAHGSSLTQDNSEGTQDDPEDPMQRKFRMRRLRISGYRGNFNDHMSEAPSSAPSPAHVPLPWTAEGSA